MRLAGQAKLGFYPADPGAISELLKHLRVRPPDPTMPGRKINVIDPCAGEGLALKQIADGLGVESERVYAVELDGDRAAKVRENIPGSQVIGPASFLGCDITGQTLSLAYVNPPFDDELGGGRREEQSFVEMATRLLVPHGILVLVCPLTALSGNNDFIEFLDSKYEHGSVFKFPDAHRKFKEIVYIPKKRRNEIPRQETNAHGTLSKMGMRMQWVVRMDAITTLGGRYPAEYSRSFVPSYEREPQPRVYDAPLSFRPNTFKKAAFTDEELTQAIAASPLNEHFQEIPELKPKRPPLPLDRGQLGLILASGILDGVVEGPHGVHIVRGGSYKVEYHNKEASGSEKNPESGAVTTKDVFSQRPVTVIRCLDESGTIYTHSNDEKPAESGVEGPQEKNKAEKPRALLAGA